MPTDLALLLMVLAVALAVPTIVVCWLTARRAERARRDARILGDRLSRAQPELEARLRRWRSQAHDAVRASMGLVARLDRADEAMAVTSRRLRDGRGSIDAGTRERLVPLARWCGRVVAMGRLWRMRREMWRG